MRLLLVVAMVGCSSAASAPAWPPGSKITPNTCFEHQTERGWEPVQLRGADGRLPFYSQAVKGEWYFPMDTGALRLRPCE